MQQQESEESQAQSQFSNTFHLQSQIQSPHIEALPQNQIQQIPSNIQTQKEINQNEQLQALSILNQNPNLNIDLNLKSFNNNNINEHNNNININPEIKKTKLENRFSFWYRISDDIVQYQAPKQTLDKKIYETQVKKIHEFDTVEDFWGIFQHLRKPDSCKPGIEFMMFKEPIKPMWEDENNKNGGKISIKLRKEYTTIIWEEMIFALIGGILPEEMKEEINGIVVSSRREFNTLQIWFKTFEERINNDLEQCIRDLLVIPPEVNLEFKQFNKSKKDYNEEKKSGGYNNYKGYSNYYDNNSYDYKEEKNQYKKKKYYNYNKNK